MRETFRFGRVAGIPVGANWSVAIIAWILVVGLAMGALPEAAPDQPVAVYWLAGVAATVLFLASLLAHEVAHALVARAAGLPVQGITLWALGGVSKLGGDAPSARDELRIALAGPATSLALGLAFLGATVALDLLGVATLVVATAAWLAMINLILGLFNLAPAFPLDGGRVVRAVLWAHHGDRVRATRSAAAAGRAFGYGLVGLGAILALNGAVAQGLWLVLLGWFVVSMAQAEASSVEQRQLLEGVTLAEVMSSPAACVGSDLSLEDVLQRHVLVQRYSAYPVVDDDGRLRGLVTLDTVRRVPPSRRLATAVLEAAVPAVEVPQAPSTDLLSDHLDEMATSPTGRLVVVDHGRVTGLVSHTDVVSCLRRRALLTR